MPVKTSPKVRLVHFPMNENRRFKLTVNVEEIDSMVASDGKVHFWVDRGDVMNLSFDCSTSLLEDDLNNDHPAAVAMAGER
jgi:hypothetical protein